MYRDQLVSVYCNAFHPPPSNKGETDIADFVQSCGHHTTYSGFRIVIACDQETDDVVGFTYGFANMPDHFFHVEMAKFSPPQMMETWLANCFRLVEIAVIPQVQGRGIGGRLHDQLLQNLPYERAVLATIAAETSAYRMYQKRGWQILLEAVDFPGVPRPYRVMGLNFENESGKM